jgi:HD superfamily phosphohydrolase
MSEMSEIKTAREELRKALGSRYKIEEKPLGMGGAGIAFRVRDTASSVLRVAKILRPTATALRDEFYDEARKLSPLHHPNLIAVFEQSPKVDLPYFVMQFVSGSNLDKAVCKIAQRSKRGEWVGAMRRIFFQLADVLAYLHSQKPHALLHLDIKPENVILTQDYRRQPAPILLDLGISRFETGAEASAKETLAFGTFIMWPKKYIDKVKRLTHQGRTLFRIDRSLLNAELDLHLLGKTMEMIFKEAIEKDASDRAGWEASAKSDIDFLRETALRLDIDGSGLGGFRTAIELRDSLQRLEFRGSRTRHSFDLGWVRLPGRTVLNFGRQARNLTDWPKFQRLRGIGQLGFVSLVFPGATHTRFEHSLGVFENTITMLDQVAGPSGDERFRSLVSDEELIATAIVGLFHDVGHYPFAHQFRLQGEIPVHEERTLEVLRSDEARALIRSTFNADVYKAVLLLMGSVYALLKPTLSTRKSLYPDYFSVLRSVVSGTIDADKLDYVSRDALHAGVPYGAVVDRERFLASLRVWWDRDDHPHLLLSEKGRVCAEALVFARYLMTSEVYWNHAVRAYAAMLSAAIDKFPLEEVQPHLWDTDMAFLQWLSRDKRTNWLQDLIDRRTPYRRAFVHQILGGEEGSSETDRRLFDLLEEAASGRLDLLTGIRKTVASTLKIASAKQHEIVLDLPKGVTTIGGIQVLPEGHKHPGSVGPIFDAIGENFNGFGRKARIFVHPKLMGNRSVADSTLAVRKALVSDLGLA